MEIRKRSTYEESLAMTDGNHIAAAILQLADELFIEFPSLIEAMTRIADAMDADK